ncbi:MAG: hypothetical protein PHC90_04310 [Syntrophorhabdaceae bacterium]|nr:hypothetical protein [Syntrophorhabdaceae bacterium]
MEKDRAFRSMLFALWSVLLCFVGLNPVGMFLFLWVLAIPAWVLACLGLYHGMKAILLREPRRALAILGTVICTAVVLLPLYPVVWQWYVHHHP